MANEKRQVIFIESYPTIQEGWREFFGSKLKMLQVFSEEKVLATLAKNPKVDAVVLAGKLSNELTDNLLKDIKKKFKGPIIGVSNDDFRRRDMNDLGCEHVCGKDDLESLSEFLGLK